MEASALDPSPGDYLTHALLLTPEGVTSPPVELNAPEPGTMAVALAALAAVALRQAVGALRRRRIGGEGRPD